ncbi:hypothetical protein DIURU_003531 [Diutina rugosa]|uniref:Uncharacterized protein n=1 Tax=Diutina rugosa TaxID=5481 RepID=A0A642ULC8_DIURU|nr:uncharacterized protein DIURU_003531 [Diutina rugosa]KAA8901161.1 hypothetical protein DIURU_003531 [Diutina rugosa]
MDNWLAMETTPNPPIKVKRKRGRPPKATSLTNKITTTLNIAINTPPMSKIPQAESNSQMIVKRGCPDFFTPLMRVSPTRPRKRNKSVTTPSQMSAPASAKALATNLASATSSPMRPTPTRHSYPTPASAPPVHDSSPLSWAFTPRQPQSHTSGRYPQAPPPPPNFAPHWDLMSPASLRDNKAEQFGGSLDPHQPSYPYMVPPPMYTSSMESEVVPASASAPPSVERDLGDDEPAPKRRRQVSADPQTQSCDGDGSPAPPAPSKSAPASEFLFKLTVDTSGRASLGDLFGKASTEPTSSASAAAKESAGVGAAVSEAPTRAPAGNDLPSSTMPQTPNCRDYMFSSRFTPLSPGLGLSLTPQFSQYMLSMLGSPRLDDHFVGDALGALPEHAAADDAVGDAGDARSALKRMVYDK